MDSRPGILDSKDGQFDISRLAPAGWSQIGIVRKCWTPY